MDSYTPERWSLLSNLLGEALERSEVDREAFLDEACAGDEQLRLEVDQLLRSYYRAQATERFERGALDLVEGAFPQIAPSKQVGPYRLIREIGQGGMGSVWLAERADGVYEQEVAVKFMHATCMHDEYRTRFDTERRILARLNHPNIARIYDGGVSENDQPFLVMEYVDAATVVDHCNAKNLDVDQRLRLFLTICDAVGFAHQNLIVHRDLKPSNILVTDSGGVKLLDFGIAKMLSDDDAGDDGMPVTRALGGVLVTPEYAAPEQVKGEAVTTATDVYSLGVVLYELLTRERPYDITSRTPSGIEETICRTVPVRPSTAVKQKSAGTTDDETPLRTARQLRGDLDTIILKALSKEPERRYAGAAQLADDLRRHLSGLPVEARPDSPFYRIRKFVRRHTLPVSAAAVVIIALIVGLVVSITQTRVANAARERADVVNEFLREMLASADPYADGPDVRVADLLERAGAMLPTRFADRPDLEGPLRYTLGTSYMELGMYDEAKEHLGHALELVRDHRDGDLYVDALATLGSLHRRLGDYHVADSMMTDALERDIARYGPRHRRVGIRYGELGAIKWESGDYEGADEFFTRSLDIHQATDTPDSLNVAVALAHIAVLRADQGRTAEAEGLYRRSLAIQRVAYGDLSPEIPQLLSHIAIIRDDLEDYDEAHQLHTQALELYRRIRGERHPDVAYAMSNLASVETQLGNFERADSLQRAAIDINIEVYGEDHTVVGILYNNMGARLKAEGNLDRALDSYQRAVATWRAGLPPGHPYLGYGLHNLGTTLLALNRDHEALPILKEAYDLRVALLDEDNPERAATSSVYGEALARSGNIAQAESLIVASHASLQRAFGDEHSATVAAAERMADYVNRPTVALSSE